MVNGMQMLVVGLVNGGSDIGGVGELTDPENCVLRCRQQQICSSQITAAGGDMR